MTDLENLFALARNTGPYIPPTEDLADPHYVQKLKRLQRGWVSFCGEAGVTIDEKRPFHPLPNLNAVVAFLQYLCRTKTGNIDPNGKITVSTLESYWRGLKLLIWRQTGMEYSLEDRVEVDKHITKGIARAEGLSTQTRHKDLADRPVVENILRFLWEFDEHRYDQSRVRVQLALGILFILFMGLRPGEITESNAHPGSNEGLHWGDVTVLMIPGPDGKRIWLAQLQIRNRKGQRDRDDKTPVENIREDAQEKHMCPISLLFALAIADGAFAGIRSAEDFGRVRFNPKQPVTVLRVKKEMKHVPILRRLERNRSISSTNILPTEKFSDLMKHLAWRAGYTGKFLPYSVRRGHGNTIDRKISAVQRRRQMGHKSDDVFMNYISAVSGVDIQNVVNGREPDQALIDYVRSMQPHVDHGVPLPDRSLLTDVIRRDPKTLDYASHREKYFAQEEDIYEGSSTAEPYTTPAQKGVRSRFLETYLRYNKPRAQMISSMQGNANDVKEHLLMETLPSLATLSCPDEDWTYPLTKPSENYTCRRCSKQGTRKLNTTEFNSHLLKCQQFTLSEKSRSSAWTNFFEKTRVCMLPSCGYDLHKKGPDETMEHMNSHFVVPRRPGTVCRWAGCDTNTKTKTKLLEHLVKTHGMPLRHECMKQAKFCYECSEFFIHEEVWEDHCASHLLDMDAFCGQIVCRGIIISARKCIFCLPDSSLSAAERYHSFTSTSSFFQHLHRHLGSLLKWPIDCPHPNCSGKVPSEKAFWNHVKFTHGIAKYKAEPAQTSDTAIADPESCTLDVDVDSAGTLEHETWTGSCGASDPGLLHSAARGHLEHTGSTSQPNEIIAIADIDALDSEDLSCFGQTEHRAIHTQHTKSSPRQDPSDFGQFDNTQVSHFVDGMEGNEYLGYVGMGCSNVEAIISSDFLAIDALLQRSEWQADIEQPTWPSSSSVAPLCGDMTGLHNDYLHTQSSAEEVRHVFATQTFSTPEIVGSAETHDVFLNLDTPLEPMSDPNLLLEPLLPLSGSMCGANGCNQRFRFVRDLTYHQMKVHKQSPYTCGESGCGKMFRDASRLREHERTHSSTKRLVCNAEQCHRTFLRTDTLLRHRQIVHDNGRPYTCDKIEKSRRCRSAFDENWKLTRHKKKVHKCT